jgi:glycosyltransferase involved in cell wall biosynthesis
VIAYLHQAEAWGAVERYLEQLLAGLDEPAVVIHPRSAELERLSSLAESKPYDPRSPAPALFAHLVRELRTFRPRVVHVVDVWPLAVLAARAARVQRVIVTHHTPELPRHDNLVGRTLWRLGKLARPELIYTSATDRARDGGDGVVIELGIDLSRFDVPRRPHDGLVVGNVARLVEQKDQRTLVASAPEILDRFPDARFVVVGDGPLRGDLESRAAGLPFELTGERADVPDLLAGFDVFAFPSLYEGLCLAVIEAQAAGVPVVATPVGGIRETVVDGETGLLVPPQDPHALATAVCRVLEDEELAARLAAEAGRRTRGRFSVERMVEQTLELYCPAPA